MARILIADDDAGVRDLLARLCAFQGHEALIARDANAAVELYDAETPDLVLLDLALPPSGGQAVAERVHGDTLRRCPIVVITGYADVLAEKERTALRAHAILRKPLEIEELFAAVSTALGEASAA